MDSSWPKEQPYSPHLLHQGYNHKNWSQKRKMSPLSPKSENLCFCPNLCYLIGSLTHSFVKIIPLDHFDVNIDGIISNLEYWGQKVVLQHCFLQALENEDKIMICSFFKFSMLEHFWALKLIVWVDIRVLLVFYLFQSVRVDMERELEKWTKYVTNYRILKIYVTQLWQPIYVEN